MDKKTIILVVTIFTLLVAGMFGYAYLKKTEIETETQPVDQEPEEVLYPDVTRIDAKQYYIDGEHTFVGEIILPTPCDLLDTKSSVMKSLPEKIQLDFTVINNSSDCPKIETVQRFSVSAVASSEASVEALFMGRPVELNLIPAAEGELPEEFELFIKG